MMYCWQSNVTFFESWPWLFLDSFDNIKIFLAVIIELRRKLTINLKQFEKLVDFLIRSQVGNNLWFYHHPDLHSKRVRIQTLLIQYTAALAQYTTSRHWTLNDFNTCTFRLIEILYEVVMYQTNVCRLFVKLIN
jgi:hypothetical protein